MSYYDHSSVGFQMYGYGGFGYDTSHVPPDQGHSELYKAAEAGDLEKAKKIISETRRADRDRVLNHARRWTEVDFKASGFTKEYEWFDSTALSVAASMGRWQVVKFLLEQGADPTLMGVPGEGVYHDSAASAKSFLDRKMKAILHLRTQTTGTRTAFYGYEYYLPKGGQTSIEKASEILMDCEYAKYIVALLEAALKFWDPAPYRGVHYSATARQTFSNRPKDHDGMLEALERVPVPSPLAIDNDPKLQNEVRLISATLERLRKF